MNSSLSEGESKHTPDQKRGKKKKKNPKTIRKQGVEEGEDYFGFGVHFATVVGLFREDLDELNEEETVFDFVHDIMTLALLDGEFLVDPSAENLALESQPVGNRFSWFLRHFEEREREKEETKARRKEREEELLVACLPAFFFSFLFFFLIVSVLLAFSFL